MRAAPDAASVGAALVVADPDDADDGRREPADGRQEAEGDDGLPVTALADTAEGQTAPVEDAATRVADELCCV